MSCYSVGKLLVLQHLTLQSEIHIGIQIPSSPEMNGIGCVLVSILSSANDCGFEPANKTCKHNIIVKVYMTERMFSFIFCMVSCVAYKRKTMSDQGM
jgi:hypothetical protein